MGSRLNVTLNACFVFLLALGVHGQANVAAPTNQNFVRRGFQSSIVLGDYLYITGGELAQTVDGALSIYPQNNTLSIDLRYSWTNSSVSFNVITQGAPVLNTGVLWPSQDESSFYAWAGEQSSLSNISVIPVPTNDLWRFDVNGQGGGTWQSSSVPSNFVRTSTSQYTSGGDVGYILGGYVSDRTSPENALLGRWEMSPGMVSYNMTTGAWLNESSCVGDSCYRDNGYMQFVDGFGSSGVIVALGGCTQTTPTYFGQCNATSPDALSNIYIYDPARARWFTQTASNAPGQLPQPRQDFCGVGVPGDNGTYEIFIFGGGLYSDGTNDDLTYLDEVFVLSLPAFTWFKADYTPTHTRTAHSCNVVGKRQMISLGGVNPTGNLWLPADPWTQSIGVFDMTEMRWADGYDATAEDYVTPDVVKAWYAGNGPYPNWNSDDVKSLFFNKSTTTTSSPASPPATSSTETPSTGNKNDQAGLIVGGVVGALVALAVLAGVVFFFRRRFKGRGQASRTSTASGTSPDWAHIKAELPTDSYKAPSYEYVYSAPVEADDGCRKPEMHAPLPPPKERAEMEA